jgi:polygalacturonase
MLIDPVNQSESMTYAKDRNTFMRQGVEPRNAQKEGLALSSEWKTFVNGEEISTFCAPVTHAGPQSFAFIEFEGEPLHIEVEYAGPLRGSEVLPRELGIAWKQKDNRIEFTVEKECNIVIEANQSFREPLALFVSHKEENIPDPKDDKVLWFTPGIHYVDSIELKDNQTLYLSQGAILKAVQPTEGDQFIIEKDWAEKKNYLDFIFAKDKKNIRICGRGMIDTSGLDWHARRTIVFSDCNNITVTGVLLNGAAHWTMPFFGCTEVCVTNVKLIGYRENSDGINLVDCKNVLVKDCYIRTGDDAVCVKSMGLNKRFGCSDIHVKNCVVWNDKVRAFGIAGETRYEIKDIIFENCQVLNSSADWTREVGALCIVISDSATMHNIAFRKISIRHENNYVISCMIMKDMWSTDEAAGNIEDIIYEDIQIPENAMMHFEGYDKEHRIKGLHFSKIMSYETGKEVNVNHYIQKNEFVSFE